MEKVNDEVRVSTVYEGVNDRDTVESTWKRKKSGVVGKLIKNTM